MYLNNVEPSVPCYELSRIVLLNRSNMKNAVHVARFNFNLKYIIPIPSHNENMFVYYYFCCDNYQKSLKFHCRSTCMHMCAMCNVNHA